MKRQAKEELELRMKRKAKEARGEMAAALARTPASLGRRRHGGGQQFVKVGCAEARGGIPARGGRIALLHGGTLQ